MIQIDSSNSRTASHLIATLSSGDSITSINQRYFISRGHLSPISPSLLDSMVTECFQSVDSLMFCSDVYSKLCLKIIAIRILSLAMVHPSLLDLGSAFFRQVPNYSIHLRLSMTIILFLVYSLELRPQCQHLKKLRTIFFSTILMNRREDLDYPCYHCFRYELLAF